MKMRVAAITMVYNEAFFLPLWYRHYGSQIGTDNLYVIDHGSTDGSVSETFGNRIRIARDKFDDVSRATMVSDLHRILFKFYDAVIYTDVDEFVVARPGKYTGLTDYAEHRTIETPRCCGVNVVPQGPDAINLDLFHPILEQRPIAFPTHWYCKPLLSSKPLTWIPGFHDCYTPSETDPDLWLFHMKHVRITDQPDFLKKLWSERYDRELSAVDFAAIYRDQWNGQLGMIPKEFLKSV